jgi:hypothetical protein
MTAARDLLDDDDDLDEEPAGDAARAERGADHRVDAGPCATCAWTAKCAAERLACTAFALFVEGANAKKIAAAARVDASAERYARIFAPANPAIEQPKQVMPLPPIEPTVPRAVRRNADLSGWVE